MEDFNWKEFWENYRKTEANKKEDLFYQVGKTQAGKPISENLFNMILEDIQEKLELNKNDNLLEMCCGNGLFTYPLSFFAKEVWAFDFTEQLIRTAKKFSQKDNITYACGDAKDKIYKIFADPPEFDKYLMNDAAAYFTPKEMSNILSQIIEKGRNFRFYLTNVPNDENKWLFYNTPERKEKYLKAVEQGDFYLEGMGRWWKYSEFQEIAEKFSINIAKSVYDHPTFGYRMNILLYT